jgi:hypothetical protein
MASPSCNQFLDRLESWMDGQHTPEAQAHLATCPDCRAIVGDLGAIKVAAREWTASEEAPERVWVSLRTQLEQEGLIRTAPEVTTPERPARIGQIGSPFVNWVRGWFAALPRPALAGAYLAALVAVAFALSGPVTKRYDNYRWMAATQDETAPLSAALDTAEAEQNASFSDPNPVVSASLHSNLAIVDNYIALCEKSVQDDPQDEMARDYLYDAYHQKADLLAQISERGDYGR